MSRRSKRQAPATTKQPMNISFEALLPFIAAKVEPIRYEFRVPVLPSGVGPEGGQAPIAMDASFADAYGYGNTAFDGIGFPGYPHLSNLAQYSEYRSPTETTASEMTREWIKVTSKGDSDNADKIEQIEDALELYRVKEIVKTCIEHDGFFGRGQIYIDIEGADKDNAKANPLVIDKRSLQKGMLRGFKNIEPMWTTPNQYNSTDPTARDFYLPASWFIMNQVCHASRLLTMIVRPVPDMLKPAFNFGGISMSQLMEPYVQAWMRTRNSVSDLLHSFSISGIKTDMSQILQGGGGETLMKRAQLFNQARDNKGVMFLDMADEEFFQFNTPLSSLDKLQAQSQEHMSAPSHMPLVKLLGITPTGLNANSEGEIAVWYDYVRSMQRNVLEAPIKKILDIIQLDLFGDIDPAIGFAFNPLEQMSDAELATIRKSNADVAAINITNGITDAMEERERLAADPHSGYNSLEVEDVPEVVVEEYEEADD